ncbi:MAG: sigma-70 family RNA polymerase sigma factor [Parcubacteria group bacterium]
MELTDNELVELAKKSPENFGELVTRYQDRLFRYVRRISYFREEDAEDIVQEVFIKIYLSLNIFDGDLKFSTWAYQITRNATIDAIRKKQSRPQTVCLEGTDIIKIAKSDTDIQLHLETKDDMQKMQHIIDDLPYKYREVMVLRFLEDKSYEEIMDIIQKPKGTVAALINRGKKIILNQSQDINRLN